MKKKVYFVEVDYQALAAFRVKASNKKEAIKKAKKELYNTPDCVFVKKMNTFIEKDDSIMEA